MLALARASGAPRMTRADAARALGADLAQLEAALAGRAHDARRAQRAGGARTRTGLREDQAAAALSVLTDGRRVSVINAPAGSGKTWVLAATGKAWAAAGLGRVIGITPSQSARNTLAAGVPESYNSAQFLGHLPGQRGARGPVRLRPGDLVLIDEASMISNPDLADVISQAAAGGAKVILAGDTQQLQAVQNGGGMSLLAEALGYVRLTEPAPVPRRLGAGRQPAAPRRRHHGAGRVRPARPDPRRGAGADDGRRRGRLPRPHPGRRRHAADGRRPRAAPGAVPPRPRGPDPPRHRPAVGGHRPRPGAWVPGPPGVAAAGRLPRRLARTVRLSPSRRPDRARAAPAAPDMRAAWQEASLPSRPRRRPGRAGHAGRDAAAPARHLSGRNRLGAPVRGDELRQVRSAARDAAWPRSVPPPKPTPLSATTSTRRPAGSRTWSPATRPCTTSTLSARPRSPSPWLNAPTGSGHRPQRHLAVAADTELRRRHPGQQYPALRSAEPAPPPKPSATNSPRPRRSRSGRPASGSRTWPPSTAPSRASSPTGTLTIPSEDPRLRRPRPGVPAWIGAGQDAILQTSQAEILRPRRSCSA